MSFDSSGTDMKTIFTVYSYRWLILGMFCSLEMTNALFWVTFSPISDIAQHYFSPSSYYSSTTAVNMLANIFLITYLPGTILGVLMMKHFRLRNAFVLAGSLTVLGGLLRYIATLCADSLGVSGTYWLIFLGQFCAAMAQPTFLNMPPAVAAAWFPVNERDVATTVGSMCSPVGNAIGQILPILFVTEHSDDDVNDDNYTVKGMDSLMLCELLLAVLPLLATVLYFRDAPPTPPSQSTKLKMQGAHDKSTASSARAEQEEDAGSDEALVPAARLDRFSHSLSQKLAAAPAQQEAQAAAGADSALQRELRLLYNNRDYYVLFTIFSIGVGFFNTLMTLLNQLIAPYGYSNDDAGTFGAVFIFCGLIGAGFMSYIMEKTRAYKQILVVGLVCCVLAGLFFLCMLFSDNFAALLVSFAVLGFAVLPLLPVMMENCAEVTYPVSEDMAMGILLTGCNLSGLVFIFILQSLIEQEPWGPPPFTPANFFILLILLLALSSIFFYKGDFKRMHLEHKTDKLQDGTTNPLSFGSTGAVQGDGELSNSVNTSNLVRVADQDDTSSHAWSGRQSSAVGNTFWSAT
eukprot:gene32395-39173_t